MFFLFFFFSFFLSFFFVFPVPFSVSAFLSLPDRPSAFLLLRC